MKIKFLLSRLARPLSSTARLGAVSEKWLYDSWQILRPTLRAGARED